MVNGGDRGYVKLEFSLRELPFMIKKGLITEVKPAVWTDDDMIEFGLNTCNDGDTDNMVKAKLEKLKKEKE